VPSRCRDTRARCVRIAAVAWSASRNRRAVTISSWSRRYSSRRAAVALRRFRSPHTELLTAHVRALAEVGAAVLIVEQRARAVLAISDYTYVLGGGQVLMADTPARLNASQEFTESFFGVVPQTPRAPKPS
jgi:hypothetical protein